MEVVKTVGAMKAWVAGRKAEGRSLGFVPTMGCLHRGHLSLVDRARALADDVVVSIFVNPTQFLPGEDLDRYPRSPRQDLESCRAAGVAAVFMPEPEEMYATDASVFVDEAALSATMCGRTRPGHFRGVLTIVAKLFNIVRPDTAVFGRKDAQQAALIQRMIRDLNFDVRLEVAPLVREADGLAMSSRNRYLSPDERKKALTLSAALEAARSAWSTGKSDAREIRGLVKRTLLEKGGIVPEYIACVDAESLTPVARLAKGDLIALAAVIGRTRLIDNIRLGEEDLS